MTGAFVGRGYSHPSPTRPSLAKAAAFMGHRSLLGPTSSLGEDGWKCSACDQSAVAGGQDATEGRAVKLEDEGLRQTHRQCVIDLCTHLTPRSEV